MADEKDPKDADAPAKKPRVRRKPKAEPAAAAAKASPATERDRGDAVAAGESAAAKAKAKAKAKPADPVEQAPVAKPRRTRRTRSPGGSQGTGKTEAPAAPAAKTRRPSRDYGDNPPMVRAHAKYVRTSARKARLVCDHIRGKSVEEARAILAHASRDVARDWSKLLESAVANAEHNHELIGDELRIAAVKADEGPTLKRFRPRAMGRATKIRKRTSHLSITLTPKDGDR
jgi:ribosomal protein L22